MELSSEIGGDHYVSRLTNPGLKEIILDLYRHPGKYVDSIRKVIDTYDLVHGQHLYYRNYCANENQFRIWPINACFFQMGDIA